MRVRRVMVGGVDHTVEQLIAPFEAQPVPAVASEADALAATLAKHTAHAVEDDAWWHDPHWVADMRTSCCMPLA